VSSVSSAWSRIPRVFQVCYSIDDNIHADSPGQPPRCLEPALTVLHNFCSESGNKTLDLQRPASESAHNSCLSVCVTREQ
jgi:hypothetical protein